MSSLHGKLFAFISEARILCRICDVFGNAEKENNGGLWH